MRNAVLLGAMLFGFAGAGQCQMSLLAVDAQAQTVGVGVQGSVATSATAGRNALLDGRRQQLQAFIARNRIVPRGRWAQAPADVSQMETDWNYDGVVLHHSGNNGTLDPEAIRRLQTTRSPDRPEVYGDIAYHFAIRPNGQILEGRSLIYKGAHCRQNTGKIGVIVLGDFQWQLWDSSNGAPTPAQLAAVTRLTTALKTLFPTITGLRGHRDFVPWYANLTSLRDERECPGDALYNRLPELRRSTRLQ